MTLNDFLAEKEMTGPQFAARVSASPSTIWRIRHGKTFPDWKTMDAISRVTDGRVTPNDFASISDSSIKAAE